MEAFLSEIFSFLSTELTILLTAALTITSFGTRFVLVNLVCGYSGEGIGEVHIIH